MKEQLAEKLDKIISDYKAIQEFITEMEYRKFQSGEWINIIEEMFHNGETAFKDISKYSDRLNILEKAAITKYIKWQNDNKEQSVYDYIINFLKFYDKGCTQKNGIT